MLAGCRKIMDKRLFIAGLILIVVGLVVATIPSRAKCPSCDGVGKIECPSCDGTGHQDCPLCDAGRKDCPMCVEGKSDCLMCVNGKCSICNGDGCLFCDFTGKCQYCNGLGYTVCTYCNGVGYTTCEYCDGDGSISCAICGGKGWKNCVTCNGQGSISIWFTYLWWGGSLFTVGIIVAIFSIHKKPTRSDIMR